MGFGGILASIAQGLGGGIVKVADKAWEQEAEDKKYKFYADQKELDRTHDIELTNLKHQQDVDLEKIRHKSKLGEIAAQSRADLKDSPNKKAINQQKDIIGAIKRNNAIIASIDEKLQDPTLGEKEKAQLVSQKEYLSSKNADYYHDKTWADNPQTGEEIRAEREDVGWGYKEYGKYAPKPPETPAVTPTVNKPSQSSERKLTFNSDDETIAYAEKLKKEKQMQEQQVAAKKLADHNRAFVMRQAAQDPMSPYYKQAKSLGY